MVETKNSMDDIKDDSKVTEPQTSRPIVVGNTNEVVDDTIVPDKPDMAEKSKKVIKPLTDEEKQEQKPEEESAKIEIKSETPSEEDKAEKTDKSVETATEQSTPTEAPVEGSSEVDTIAGEVSTKRQDELAQKEQEAKQAELEKKIESKEYFLPIKDSPTGGKLGTVFLLLLVVGVAVIGAGYYYMTTAK